MIDGQSWAETGTLNPVEGDKFPDGADTEQGNCDGLCHRTGVEVARVALGPTWRTTMQLSACASCLSDYVAGAPAMGCHVRCTDGLFREVVS